MENIKIYNYFLLKAMLTSTGNQGRVYMKKVLGQRVIHRNLQTVKKKKNRQYDTVKFFANFVELQRSVNQNEIIHPNYHTFPNVIPFKMFSKNLSIHLKDIFNFK